ncbi:MAG: amidohydrolase [Oleispira sp.]
MIINKPRVLALSLAVLTTSLLQACGGAQAGGTSDNSAASKADRQLWLNGDIYTVNKAQPWAEAMVIEKGQLLFVGPESEAKAWVNETTQIHDLKGKTVLPGLHDVHLHPLEASSDEIQCILDSSKTVSIWVENIKACAKQNPPFDNAGVPNAENGEWLLGWGHSILTLVESAKEPRQLLDELNETRPIAIMEETSHSVWVNSKALELLKLDGIITEQNIAGGAVLLNAQGKSTGVLLDGAGDLAFDLAMAETPERLERNYQSLLAGLDEVAKNGITSIVDARIYWQRGYLKAWQRARDENALTARSVLSLWAYPNINDEEQIKHLTSLYENDIESMLRINQIKFYSDGITHNATSALLAPYEAGAYYEEVGPTGLNYFNEQRLTHYATELSKVGFNMHIHAIGDRAVRESLNAIEAAQLANKAQGDKTQGDKSIGRHRLTHVEMVAESDKKRFAELDVIADFQLAGEFTLPENFEEMEPLIGDRAHAQLPVRDIYDTGAVVTLSSDWDVSSLSPFVGMQNALNRGEQSLPDLASVIEAYTINGAYVMDQDHLTGSIEVGKEADFIVIDQNPFKIDSNKISEIKVLKTILAGEIVYQ